MTQTSPTPRARARAFAGPARHPLINDPAEIWLQAMETGAHRQCKGAFQRRLTEASCALGLAANLFGGGGRGWDGAQPALYGVLGLSDAGVRRIMRLNDRRDEGLSFPEIAVCIRQDPDYFFMPRPDPEPEPPRKAA